MNRINVTKSFLPPKEEYDKIVAESWETGWITNHGPLVTKLETALKNYFNVNFFLFLNNGTNAIQIAIKALELKGEVITTPFSYVATTSSLVWENCLPVFADINPDTFNIDPEAIEGKISDKTRAILATHVYGNPCEVKKIKEIADKNGLYVIYDAAHCFGTKVDGKSILNWGDISTISFHATKLFHTVEGGGVATNSDALHHKMSFLRNFGHNGPEEFWGLGINGKNSEFHAAMGISLFEHLETIFSKRKERYEYYKSHLDAEHLKYQKIEEINDYNYAYFPVVFPNSEMRRRVQEELAGDNIISRRYFYPSLNKLPYVQSADMPNSELLADCVLCLPFYPDLSFEDMDRIIDILNRTVK